MRRAYLFSSIVMISFSLAACLEIIGGSITASQIDAEMKPWIGSSKDQLVKAWGAPASTFPGDEYGGEIWTYSFSRLLGNPPQEYTAIRQFYINSAGIIYGYWWKEPTEGGSISSGNKPAS